MGGRLRPESVAGINRNGWPASPGIGGRNRPEYAVWKPWQHLWSYCEQTGYDFFEVRYLIEERIGHKLTCECQLVDGGKERRRLELQRTFGVDFGEPGDRGVDVL
jgi:hypothetical protein